MRGLWCVIVLASSVAGLGCHGKPRRILQQPQGQIYDLPPMEEKKFSEPPTYPEEKAGLKPKKDQQGPPGGLGGLGGPSMGPAGAGGAGGGRGPGGY